jgi:hypothetical protein
MEQDKKETKNWAEMSDEEGDNEQINDTQAEKEQSHVIKQKAKAADVPPPIKGKKNERGDYIVSQIIIPDFKTEKKAKTEEEEESESESEEYGEEEDAQEAIPEEAKEDKSKWKLTFLPIGVSVFGP